MFKRLEEPGIFNKALIMVFLICFIYWGYLLFATEMSISCDAIGYEGLGSMIYKEGWIEYFKTGPNREPLYPLTIAISMRIADIFSVSYQIVQKFIQIMFLFITQILILAVLNKLKISNKIKLIAILYFGLSPAIVNSAFCLLSEIVTYPFVLAAVLFGALSWRAIYNLRPIKRVVILSFATSVLFTLATFGKGVFQYVYLLFLMPYLCLLVNSIRKGNKKIILHSFLYIIVGILVINSFIIPFKLMNKRFNGHFVFTDSRYAWAFYGSAEKRTNPLTLRIFLAHLASIPGGGICRLFFSEKECWYTEWEASDVYGRVALDEVSREVPADKVEVRLLFLTFKRVMTRPLQYLLLTVMEIAKAPFWESTQMAFVGYPIWLQNLFSVRLFRYGIRFIVAVLTYLSIFSMTVRTFKNRSRLFDSRSDKGESWMAGCLIILVIFVYSVLHSLYAILARYLLPLASLYIICIAYFVHNKIYKI